jgi:hypothetical protein
VSRWIDALRTGFWFLPMLMLVAAAGLALLLIERRPQYGPGYILSPELGLLNNGEVSCL